MYHDDFVIGLPCAGKLKPILNSDDPAYGGFGCLLPEIKYEAEPFREFSHRAHLALPPLSAQYFTFTEEKSHASERIERSACRPGAGKES